jgi:uncharacterized protein
MERNPVGWFEIPVNDMMRAKTFYEAVIQTTLQEQKMGDAEMYFFPFEDIKGAGGTLIKHENYKPSDQGVLIYFTSPTGNLKKEAEIAKINGGKVLVPTMSIGEHGHITILLDSEGNRFALHTRDLKED